MTRPPVAPSGKETQSARVRKVRFDHPTFRAINYPTAAHPCGGPTRYGFGPRFRRDARSPRTASLPAAVNRRDRVITMRPRRALLANLLLLVCTWYGGGCGAFELEKSCACNRGLYPVCSSTNGLYVNTSPDCAAKCDQNLDTVRGGGCSACPASRASSWRGSGV